MDDIGKLILRFTLGGLMLPHGIQKITAGVTRISGMLEGHGLPGALAYGVYAGEVLAPLLVLAGFYSRVGALVIVVNMLFAIGLVHMNDLLVIARTGGWGIELQAFFLFSALALVFLGPGRYAVNRR